MAARSLFSKGILAALAATVALTSMPVSAQERSGWGGRGRAIPDSNEQRPIRAPRPDGERTAAPQRAWSQSAPPAPVARQQREWRGPREADGGQVRRGWGGSDGGERMRRYREQGSPSASWQGNRESWRQRDGSAVGAERNRAYANPDRNGSYRQGYRDGIRRDDRQDRRDTREAWRDGYRDGIRRDDRQDRRDTREAWRDGYRDGIRRDGRDDGWRSGDRRYGWGGSQPGWNGSRWNGYGNRPAWNDSWRRDSRYDWYNWRNQHRSIFRPGRYYAPFSGYRYNRVGIGIVLNSGFYGDRYRINDPWSYRLPPAYGPYRWIRYYDDVLLVDTYTGEVRDVIHDFFW